MNITILDDYQNMVKTLAAFSKAAGHNVTIWNDHTKNVDVLAERLKDTEALALIRERTPIQEPLLARLPKLRIISQVGAYPHIDANACTRHGVIVSSYTGPGRPSYATAELNWGLMIVRGKTLGVYGYGRIGAVIAGYGRAFGMNGLVWAARRPSRRRAPTATTSRRARPLCSSSRTWCRFICG